MRTFLPSCTTLAALALVAPALAENQKREPDPAEIIVEGVRNREKQISDFVLALTKAPVDGQIGRFEEPVCPLAIGLSPNQNKSVAARLRRVAAAAGINVAKEGCKPNTFIIVAQDKEEMIKALRNNWADPLGNRVQVPQQSGPAVAVHVEGRLDSNGEPPQVNNGQEGGSYNHYVVVKGAGEPSWRIKPGSRPHFLLSALVVEPDALIGLTTVQLADYSAMRLLARTDPGRLEKTAAPTILKVLDAPMESEVPITMTNWDLGFLKALYGSRAGRYAAQQRGEMGQLLSTELDTAGRETGRE